MRLVPTRHGTPLFRSILLLPQAVAHNLLYHLLGSTD